MPDRADPIRIRITSRQREELARDTRDTFWSPSSSGLPEMSSYAQEVKLERQLGPAIGRALVSQFSWPLRTIDQSSFSDFRRQFFKEFGPERPGGGYGNEYSDAFARFMEFRIALLRETPALRDAQQRIALAATVVFSARIAGYSSLNVDLSVGSIQSLAEAFDGHFDSFRVFLEAFVPKAFAEVFSEEFTDTLAFTIDVPYSWSAGFEALSTGSRVGPRREPNLSDGRTKVAGTSNERERAEWLWKLANGSLLVPFGLAVFVMFHGLGAISEIYREQRGALSPVLEHQLSLLKEDRLRMSSQVSNTRSPDADTDHRTSTPAKSQAPDNLGN